MLEYNQHYPDLIYVYIVSDHLHAQLKLFLIVFTNALLQTFLKVCLDGSKFLNIAKSNYFSNFMMPKDKHDTSNHKKYHWIYRYPNCKID